MKLIIFLSFKSNSFQNFQTLPTQNIVDSSHLKTSATEANW